MSAAERQNDFGITTTLVVRAAGRMCAFELLAVREVTRPLAVEGLPEAPPWVLGLSQVRGSAVPVVSLAGILGQAAGEAGRWVVVHVGQRRVAVAVESVVGIRSLPRDALAAMPPLAREAHGDVIAAVGRLDAGFLSIIETSHLVPGGLWEALLERGVADGEGR